jgi:glyoxylase-like metal-dependent hydrolase (beta-lactamase superfamily II)
MTRVTVWIVLIALGGVSLAVVQAQQPGQPVREIQHVEDNLYFIPASDRNTYEIGGYVPDDTVRTKTTGGNTAVWITDEGAVLVDTMNPGSGPELMAQVRSITDKPVIMIINTHTHFDHTGSNTEFPASVQFVAHENIRASLAQTTCAPVTHCEAFQGDNARFLPTRTFSERMSLLDGPDRIDLYYFGRGHTDGDTFVVFPRVRAMHTGDMFQRRVMPFIDAANGGGNALEFTQTLTRAVTMIEGVDTVIAGHNPTPLGWSDFEEYTEYYAEFVTSVQDASRAGKTVDEAVTAYTPSDRYQWYVADPERVKQNAESIYASTP